MCLAVTGGACVPVIEAMLRCDLGIWAEDAVVHWTSVTSVLVISRWSEVDIKYPQLRKFISIFVDPFVYVPESRGQTVPTWRMELFVGITSCSDFNESASDILLSALCCPTYMQAACTQAERTL